MWSVIAGVDARQALLAMADVVSADAQKFTLRECNTIDIDTLSLVPRALDYSHKKAFISHENAVH
jgi:hypothetical protein